MYFWKATKLINCKTMMFFRRHHCNRCCCRRRRRRRRRHVPFVYLHYRIFMFCPSSFPRPSAAITIHDSTKTYLHSTTIPVPCPIPLYPTAFQSLPTPFNIFHQFFRFLLLLSFLSFALYSTFYYAPTFFFFVTSIYRLVAK